ncbi:MAG TPA: hypothetical protein VME18_04230 [Acidobacteriaceae bacterium]|nr:hypothetical protein [Acidobacteriaceae bacterium]
MSIVPQELDWVSTRAACNIEQVFDELCLGIQKDIEAINHAKGVSEEDKFAANMTNKTIVVAQSGRMPRIVVKIGIVGESIVVADAATVTQWQAHVAVNDAGRCTLRLEDRTELEQWQFRQKALQRLFFGD